MKELPYDMDDDLLLEKIGNLCPLSHISIIVCKPTDACKNEQDHPRHTDVSEADFNSILFIELLNSMFISQRTPKL